MPASENPPVFLETAPRQRRSVFGNYPAVESGGEHSPPVEANTPSRLGIPIPGCGDLAMTRAFVHQFLARAFDYPSSETWVWVTAAGTRDALADAVAALEPDATAPLRVAQASLAAVLEPGQFEAFHDDYVTAIGHAARGSCPVNEIEYGDLKADPLFQPHRLADLAAFYRAFGMEVAKASDERLDHLAVELEFMGVLAAQEAHWLNTQPAGDALAICQAGQRQFLREHLGRWTPAFARRLRRAMGDGALGTLAVFLLAFTEIECRRVGVTPGSEELLLRPADESASLCEGCGLAQPLPGAVPATSPA